MPQTPGTSAPYTVDPSIHTEMANRTDKQANPVSSTTQDPAVGIEIGRTATLGN